MSRDSSSIDVLILGGHGQVGVALEEAAAEAGRDPASVLAAGRGDVDITEPEQVKAALERYSPRWVVSCAVFQPVDRCEAEPVAAFSVNAVAVGRLAEACRPAGARLVHVSTDYVFGGGRRKPYEEDDLPAPLGVYAASKLAGEHLALAASELHMVVRTSAVFGTARPGHGTAPFVERMLERALNGQRTRVVTDQVVSPTYAPDLARSIWALLDAGGTGVFHAAGGGACSWFDLAKELFKAADAIEHLGPTTAAEFGAPARRPDYSALANVRLRELGIPEPRPWRDGLRAWLAERYPDLSLRG